MHVWVLLFHKRDNNKNRAMVRDFIKATMVGGSLLAAAIVLQQDTQESGSRLIASPETRASLGAMADHLPRWAGMDILVITRDDLARHGYDGTGGADFFPSVTEAFANVTATLDPFPFDRFEREGLSRQYLRSIVDASPRGFPLQAREEGENNVCAIVIPDPDEDRRDYLFRKTSNLSSAGENLPGSAAEWTFLTIAHETGHCGHSFDDQRPVVGLQFEREADQHSIDIYMRDAEAVLGIDINDLTAVPEALVALRGINGLTSRRINYANSAGLTVPGVFNAASVEPEELADNIERARDAIRNYILTGDPDADAPNRGRIDPARQYQAAKALYDSGYFDEMPVQKRFVRDFLTGAERYYRSHYALPEQPAPPTFQAG